MPRASIAPTGICSTPEIFLVLKLCANPRYLFERKSHALSRYGVQRKFDGLSVGRAASQLAHATGFPDCRPSGNPAAAPAQSGFPAPPGVTRRQRIGDRVASAETPLQRGTHFSRLAWLGRPLAEIEGAPRRLSPDHRLLVHRVEM